MQIVRMTAMDRIVAIESVKLQWFAAYLSILGIAKDSDLSYMQKLRLIQAVVRDTIVNTAGTIIGLAIGLAILAIIAGLSILASGTSAGIQSAIAQINAFLVLVGLSVAVAVVLKALDKI